MGYLNKTTAYLSGPIDYDPDPVSWREQVTKFLVPYGVTIYDPTKKTFAEAQESQDSIGERKKYKEAGNYAKVRELMDAPVLWDLGAIDQSRIIIARIDERIPMCGTVWELAVASSQRKLILLFSTSGKRTINDWFFRVIPLEHIFEDMADMFQYLQRLNEDLSVEPTGRFKIL
jgi:nucleoside 2-deoxyribosyltransferase